MKHFSSFRARERRAHGRFFSYGGALNAGPGRETHGGPHGAEVRAAKKAARRAAWEEILEGLEEALEEEGPVREEVLPDGTRVRIIRRIDVR